MQTITSPITWGNTQRTKGELHPCAEGQEKIRVSKLSPSQNDSANKVNSEFLTAGKKAKPILFPD